MSESQTHGSPPPRHGVSSAFQESAPSAAAGSASPSQSPYPSQSASPNSPTGKPIRRRMRMITSCLECRRRKLKCNKKSPCENCVKFSRECVFLSSKLDEASQMRLTEIKEKVGSLERALERDIAKTGTSSRAPSQQGFVVDDIDYGLAEDLDPWPSSFVGVDTVYDDETSEGIEDVLDLGVQVGRMRITERIGGLSRPRLSEEILAAIGPQLPRVQGIDASVATAAAQSWTAGSSPDRSVPEFMQPGPTYIPPSGGLLFGQTTHSAAQLDLLLPSRATCDQLMDQYFRAVHPVARCLHKPTFREDYLTFWDEACSNIEPRVSTQAVMFAVMFSAAASLNEKDTIQRFGLDRQVLVNNLKIAAETALCKASFLRTTRTETVQALVIYLLPLCRAELSRAHSSLVGAAIRLAECIGLHRDGEILGLNPVDTHIRRLLWHQLCFLDIRTAEAHGPRPFIRREEYDTKLPVNCAEDAIRPSAPPPIAEDGWTPMLLPLIRFEINEMMRVIWQDRRKLESKKMLLTELLSKTENFRKRMIVKYESMLSDDDPVQRYTKLVMHLLLYRLYAMVLHGYYRNDELQLPHPLNNVLLMAGIMIIEIAIQIENDRGFRDWSWYFGAYAQYQIALLLATEVFYNPHGRESGRIWACLDYVFNLDRNMPSDVKVLHILNEVQTKCAVYNNIRNLKSAPGIKSSSSSSAADGNRGQDRGSGSPEMRSAPNIEHQHQHRHQRQQQNQPQQHLRPYYQPQPATSPQSEADLLASSLSLGQTSSRAPGDGGNGGNGGGGEGGGGHSASSAGPTLPGYNNNVGHVQSHSGVNELEGIDWDTLNAIFPADPTTGELNLAGYHDPSISINWQEWR
ncbi:hypothetical protein jhhlp_002304 [Lomentospora prolificans]|uniref:Zn(2)-C6 fungal-type domain-containing protein n=1 Tax=Lomentospora prolificans TaxID=41688 RepID=A0A2N3NDM1_9PEZI|nr:hypothetical protein jhhlp_002304 [Lomentospora prolificans]